MRLSWVLAFAGMTRQVKRRRKPAFFVPPAHAVTSPGAARIRARSPKKRVSSSDIPAPLPGGVLSPIDTAFVPERVVGRVVPFGGIRRCRDRSSQRSDAQFPAPTAALGEIDLRTAFRLRAPQPGDHMPTPSSFSARNIGSTLCRWLASPRCPRRLRSTAARGRASTTPRLSSAGNT